MPSPNVITLGGTSEQRTAVATAAAKALTAATSAQTKSAAGDPPFTTYFGPATSDSKTYVSGIYGQVKGLLETAAITFDFFDVPPTIYLPNVWASLQEGATTSGFGFRIAPSFWQSYVLDSTAALPQLALSLLHELAVFTSARAVIVRFGIATDLDTREYAALAPTTAPRLAASYVAFARDLVV